MIKVSVLLKRRKDLSPEEFRRYWQEVHARIAMNTPSWHQYVRKYVQAHTLYEAYAPGEPAYDGIAQVWFDSVEAFREWRSLPEISVIRADEKNLFETHQFVHLITEEAEMM